MSGTISFQGSQLAYGHNGSGRPVVLLHGFGEDRRIWDEQAAFLSAHYQILTPDLPGSGDSELVPDMSLEGLADVVRELLDRLQIDKAVVIGHSMGGYIALAFAERYPERLLGLGLFHSTAFADSAAKKETRRKGIDFIREHGAAAFLKTVTPNLFSPGFREKNPDAVRQLAEQGNNFSAAALVLYYASMMARPDRTHVLKQTHVPVLFVIGAFDGAVPPEDSLRQCHLPGVSYFHWLPASGHMGMLEEPAAVRDLLVGFLRDLARLQALSTP